MKRKKNITSVVLVFIMILSLIGCGNSVPAVNDNVAGGNTEEAGGESIVNKVTMTEQPDDPEIVVTAEPEATAAVEPTTTLKTTPTATPELTAQPTSTPHTHDYAEMVVRQASCKEAGEKKMVCDCGDVKVEAIPATGNHSWVEQTIVVHHEAIGHMEEVQVQVGMTEGRTEYACAACDARFDTPEAKEKHCYESSLNNPNAAIPPTVCGFDEDGNPLYRSVVGIDDEGNYITEVSSEPKKWGTDTHWMARTIAYDYPPEPIYEVQSQWIVDRAAWDETVVTGSICTVCGATK